MQKLAAASKNTDKMTRTAFVTHMFELFLKKIKKKWNTLFKVHN